MNIAFCVISNRPHKMLDFAGTMNHAIVVGSKYKYQLCLSYQGAGFDLQKINDLLPNQVELIAKQRKRNKGNKFDFFRAREHSFNLFTRAHYMIMADDDFRFHTGTEQYPWTAGERYIDAVEYLERNAACGLVLMKGFLGGSQMDRWILPMSHGFYDTGLGLVFPPSRRNEWFYPKLKVLGAGEDVALCMTAFLNGYYCAKMHNVSVNKDHTKKVVALGAATVNVSKSANYNYAKWAFGKRMVELFGEFKHGGSLPVRIRDLYRHNAYKMGFDPVM